MRRRKHELASVDEGHWRSFIPCQSSVSESERQKKPSSEQWSPSRIVNEVFVPLNDRTDPRPRPHGSCRNEGRAWRRKRRWNFGGTSCGNIYEWQFFSPRGALQCKARYCDRMSSVCNGGGLWSHRMEVFEINSHRYLAWDVRSLQPKHDGSAVRVNCGRMVTDSATVTMETL